MNDTKFFNNKTVHETLAEMWKRCSLWQRNNPLPQPSDIDAKKWIELLEEWAEKRDKADKCIRFHLFEDVPDPEASWQNHHWICVEDAEFPPVGDYEYEDWTEQEIRDYFAYQKKLYEDTHEPTEWRDQLPEGFESEVAESGPKGKNYE